MGFLGKVQCTGTPRSSLSHGNNQHDRFFLLRGWMRRTETWELVRNRKSQPSTPIPKLQPQRQLYPQAQESVKTHWAIAALFTTAGMRKQCKCPLTEECIKKMCYIYTMERYSAIKKNEIMLFVATWMDLEKVPYWVKWVREGKISYDIPYRWNLKRNETNELTKQRDSQT